MPAVQLRAGAVSCAAALCACEKGRQWRAALGLFLADALRSTAARHLHLQRRHQRLQDRDP
eukprot:9107188-Lingulodinium_polyedra.AAC.1